MCFRLFLSSLFIISSSALFAQKEGYEYVNPPITIVVLGSSTAEGIGTWPRDSSWVNRYRVYTQSFNPNNQVINLGKGGFSTYQVQPTSEEYTKNRPTADTTRNFTKALQYKPDGIIINLPSNDVADGNSIEEQLNNFRNLAQLAEENGIELWVTTTQSRNFPKLRDRQLQRDLYDSLRAIFYNNYIDFWTGFCDEEYRIHKQYDSGDGCHMNNGAHAILKDRVIEAQAFAVKLEASSLQQSTTKKPKEQKPAYMRTLGFDGTIERVYPGQIPPASIELVQDRKVKALTEVRDSIYNIEGLVDLRIPVQLVLRDSNVLTTIIEFNFLELAFSQKTYSSTVYYPLGQLNLTETPTENFNYRLPNNEMVIAQYNYDSITKEIELDFDFIANQLQRMADAQLKTPDGKKVTTYWENGNKKSVLKFKNYSLDGKSVWYRETGKKKRVVHFSVGKYDGKYIDYYENGKKRMIRIFKDDREVGTPTLFKEP